MYACPSPFTRFPGVALLPERAAGTAMIARDYLNIYTYVYVYRYIYYIYKYTMFVCITPPIYS